eukprot:1945174-Rhodomonas_salina.1
MAERCSNGTCTDARATRLAGAVARGYSFLYWHQGTRYSSVPGTYSPVPGSSYGSIETDTTKNTGNHAGSYQLGFLRQPLTKAQEHCTKIAPPNASCRDGGRWEPPEGPLTFLEGFASLSCMPYPGTRDSCYLYQAMASAVADSLGCFMVTSYIHTPTLSSWPRRHSPITVAPTPLPNSPLTLSALVERSRKSLLRASTSSGSSFRSIIQTVPTPARARGLSDRETARDSLKDLWIDVPDRNLVNES